MRIARITTAALAVLAAVPAAAGDQAVLRVSATVARVCVVQGGDGGVTVTCTPGQGYRVGAESGAGAAAAGNGRPLRYPAGKEAAVVFLP